jgi:proline dehydrogenase
VAGETIDSALAAAAAVNRSGMLATLDYLGEAVHDREAARAAADTYIGLLDGIAERGLDTNISLKLTQMGQDIGPGFLRENVGRVLDRAREHSIFVRFDMESSAYVQPTLDFFQGLWEEGYHDVGVVIQAYLYRSAGDVAALNQLGARVRLCKGAYQEPESVAFRGKADVDSNFVELMRRLLSDGRYPAIATHDPRMIRATRDFAGERGIPRSAFEFQMLYGVARDMQRRLVAEEYNVRIYIPFGGAWYPYLMRRMAERPANLLFVLNAVARETPLGRLLADRGDGR